jgi:glycosyltransferase involved in cell wall biosynthesis
MRVLHIMWTLGIGGIERLVLDLATAQKAEGHAPSVLVGQAEGGLKEAFHAAEIPVLSAELSRGYQPLTQQKTTVLAAMRDADVIHVHAYNPFFAGLALKSKTPILYTDHGNNALGRKQSLSERIIFPMRDKFMSQQVDYLSFNSKFTQSQAGKRMPLSHVKNGVVYNGVDIKIDESAPSTLPASLPFNPKETFIIGTTTRFAGFKRVDRLIEAFAKMGGFADTRLLLVGDGPLRTDYEALASQLGVSSRIVFTGFQTPVTPFQDVMDVCVFPSVGEPFGLVAVETYAKGKPTLVMRDGGGILEIIEPIEPDDVASDIESLAQRLIDYREMWVSGALHNKSRISARKARAQTFNIEQMTQAFGDVYQEILGTRS